MSLAEVFEKISNFFSSIFTFIWNADISILIYLFLGIYSFFMVVNDNYSWKVRLFFSITMIFSLYALAVLVVDEY